MNIPMVTLAALMAIFPLSSGAGCLVNPDPTNPISVHGDESCTGMRMGGLGCTVIEGTSSADDIDCSSSEYRHEIYADGGNDTVVLSSGTDEVFDFTRDGGADDDQLDIGELLTTGTDALFSDNGTGTVTIEFDSTGNGVLDSTITLEGVPATGDEQVDLTGSSLAGGNITTSEHLNNALDTLLGTDQPDPIT